MKVLFFILKVFISIKLSVQSVWIVLQVKQGVFYNCSESESICFDVQSVHLH